MIYEKEPSVPDVTTEWSAAPLPDEDVAHLLGALFGETGHDDDHEVTQ